MSRFLSGRTATGTRKKTVEECFCLSLGWFRKHQKLFDESFGKFQLPGPGKLDLIYQFQLGIERCDLDISFFQKNSETKRQKIPLTYTKPNYGGSRYWFACPLESCYKRCAKLYLSRFEIGFGCRDCQNLTYRSCQEAHQDERSWGFVDRALRFLDHLKDERHRNMNR